jgi:hypothetical protein
MPAAGQGPSRHVAKLVRASAGGTGKSLVCPGVLTAVGSPRRTSHEVRYAALALPGHFPGAAALSKSEEGRELW